MTQFKSLYPDNKNIVELAKNMSTLPDDNLFEHNFELGDGRVVRLMNVEWNGKEVWSVFEDYGKGKLIITEAV